MIVSGMAPENSKNIEERKASHLELSEKSQTWGSKDKRFLYEPLFARHPAKSLEELQADLSLSFLNCQLGAPLWISSMTGGSVKSRKVNEQLALAAHKYRLGMGLGSCRPLLLDFKKYFSDFNLRPLLGDGLPLWANLGIAQVEEILQKRQQQELEQILNELKVDGLIIHLNLLQEWAQPEGDEIRRPLFETVSEFAQAWQLPLMFKEVGHGLGPESLRLLLSLNPQALETAALGGTNFTAMEQLRKNENQYAEMDAEFNRVGHDLSEMIDFLLQLKNNEHSFFQGIGVQSRGFILSGGLHSQLDAHFVLERARGLSVPAVVGMAYPFLQALDQGPEFLDQYIFKFLRNLSLAKQTLRLRSEHV